MGLETFFETAAVVLDGKVAEPGLLDDPVTGLGVDRSTGLLIRRSGRGLGQLSVAIALGGPFLA